MDIKRFLEHMDARLAVIGGSEEHRYMTKLAHDAMRITSRLNNTYHTPEEIVELMTELTGKTVDEDFRMFPPFHTDCGKNLKIGKNVFINSGCHFQDQGGITIGDSCLIGHCVVMATLNHGAAPEDRASLYPAPIILGKNVWVGANATILQGVEIGDNAIIAAGAVVTKNVLENTVVGGVPAKPLKSIGDNEQ